MTDSRDSFLLLAKSAAKSVLSTFSSRGIWFSCDLSSDNVSGSLGIEVSCTVGKILAM